MQSSRNDDFPIPQLLTSETQNYAYHLNMMSAESNHDEHKSDIQTTCHTPTENALLNELEQFEWDTFLTSVAEKPWSPNTDFSPSSSKSQLDDNNTSIEIKFISDLNATNNYSTFPTFSDYHQINVLNQPNEQLVNLDYTQPNQIQNASLNPNCQPIYHPIPTTNIYPSKYTNSFDERHDVEKKVHLTDEEKRKNHIASGNFKLRILIV